ncbi:guided entry of tail-anchored proteins factor 1-like [Wyeomyia smithii]|uniref:guided entry of tail-anchored proteins factor 1-like n=1 Tax=Wyeomyia smithii TaxID=174621 RepID=UPI002467F802|nr:guided entry of tail-anchored proteins factor 1-like [Wyeomyia smithii]
MYVIFVVTIICFLMAFVSTITKPIFCLFFRDAAEIRILRAEVDLLRRELTRISMRDEYIRYVKVERKLVTAEAELNESKNRDAGRRKVYELVVRYGLYAILALALVMISIAYRYKPIVVFGESFKFEPFGRVLNFPTGVPNGISTVFWIAVNNFVARTLASYVK